MGHVLGFHHPDAEWELNLNARLEMNASTCERAMDYVHLNLTEGKKVRGGLRNVACGARGLRSQRCGFNTVFT